MQKKNKHQKRPKYRVLAAVLALTLLIGNFGSYADWIVPAYAAETELETDLSENAENQETTVVLQETEKIQETVAETIETAGSVTEESEELIAVTESESDSLKSSNLLDAETEETEIITETQTEDDISAETELETESLEVSSEVMPEENETDALVQEATTEADVMLASTDALTYGELQEFVQANFPDANMQEAVIENFLNYFEAPDSDIEAISDEVVENETGYGPDYFTSAEEALSWLGRCNIYVKEGGVQCIDGIQYIGKDYLLATDNTYVNVVLNDAIDIQKIFGSMWTQKTVWYGNLTTGNEFYASGVLSDEGFLDNMAVITLPKSYARRWSYSLISNITRKTPLVYLRDGKEKQLFVYSNVVRHSKEDLTTVGKTKLNGDITSILLDTELQGWRVIGLGEDSNSTKWNLNFDNWDRFANNLNDGEVQASASYNFTYTLQLNYYSTVDVENVECELYGGFTYTKVSENDSEIKLSGAQFVVMNENGQYLVSEGIVEENENGEETFIAAVFSDDITEAKIYTTDADGNFKVECIPVGNVKDAENGKVTAAYSVMEVKAAPGYTLNTEIQEISVSASTIEISETYEGGEHDVKVNSDGIELKPQWQNGENLQMLLADGSTTAQNLAAQEALPEKENGFYIKNAGNEITQLKYEIIGGNYDTLQKPKISIANLADEGANIGTESDPDIVTTVDTLEDAKNVLNQVIKNKTMTSVDDSYVLQATQPIIYLDKDSVNENSNTNYAGSYLMTNTPLPVKIQFDTEKQFLDGILLGGDFQFTLSADGSNPADDPLKNTQTATNDAEGKVYFETLTFTKSGTYRYFLQETDNWYHGAGNEEDADIQFDPVTYEIIVLIEETAENGLIATIMMDGTKVGTVTSTDAYEVSYGHLEEDGPLLSENLEQSLTEKDPLSATADTFQNEHTPKNRSINGRAWLDDDWNGQREDHETVLSGITVTLLKLDTDGNYVPMTDDDGNVISVITTNEDNTVVFTYTENGKCYKIEAITHADGSYEFANLPAGTFGVRFGQEDATNELGGYFPTHTNVGADATDSDTDPTYNNGILCKTEELGIVLPKNSEIDGDYYVSPNHDSGFYMPILKISKEVKGNMGDKTQLFTFSLILTAAENGVEPGTLKFEKGDETGELKGTIQDGKVIYQFQLAHDETIVLRNLPANCSYYVQEIDGESQGYTVEYKNREGELTMQSTEALVINTKNTSVPTLVDTGFKTPMIVLAVALVGLAFTIWKRFKLRKVNL